MLRSFFTLPRYAYLVFLILAGIYFVQGDRYFGYTSKIPKTPANITSDGTGYFAYLPQYIVYPDQKPFTFIHDIVRKYPDKNFNNSPGFTETKGQITNKFYVGTPLLQSPFYLIAHGFIKHDKNAADGYSRGYRFAIQLASLFWTLLGFIALLHFLKSFGLSFITAMISVVIIALGTNLNTYSVYVPSMSHAYSFAMISLFLMACQRWIQFSGNRTLLLMGLLLGMITIIRPVNVMIIFIVPFLFDNFQSFLDRLKSLFTSNIGTILLTAAIVIAVICAQLIIHHDLSGVWSFYTYSGEGFDNWAHPKFFQVLFSSQKGFFLYAPILLLLIPGVYFLFKRCGRYFSIGWLTFILLLFYMISSWWDWTYGGGLGMRPLIEYLPLLVLPIAIMLEEIKDWKKYALLACACIGMIQFQFFQFQFNQHILPYSDVTWEQLARIKWKTAPRFEWMFYYDHDQIPPSLKLSKAGSSEFKNTWSYSGKLGHLQKNDTELSLYHFERPVCGKLTGEVRLHSDVSNPTIYLDYFKHGEKVRSTVQPFGNQVEDLDTWTPVQQSYYAGNIDFDSVSLHLETFGHTNDYKDLRIDWYYLAD